MYTRILVAIDGSPHSERALAHAIGLAKGLSAAMRIVHVIDTAWIGVGMELAIDFVQLSQVHHEAGEKLLAGARASAQAAGLEAETRLVETALPTDHIAAVIAKETSNWPADLVVLGTHGRRGVERMLLGSVAEGVARLSTVPVLLIPS
ncbi:MAG: universal stress protein [Hydrogenophilaceae bacterium]|nr:universal stress protein [Hydrogenophilaceae bacterium]